MPWSPDRFHGGFTEGKPWLPVAMEHVQVAVEAQDREPGSMLNFYRRMIDFRRAYPALLKGTYELVEADDGYIAFYREHGNMKLFCAFNLSSEDRLVTLPDGDWRVDKGAPFNIKETGEGWVLPSWQALYAYLGG